MTKAEAGRLGGLAKARGNKSGGNKLSGGKKGSVKLGPEAALAKAKSIERRNLFSPVA